VWLCSVDGRRRVNCYLVLDYQAICTESFLPMSFALKGTSGARAVKRNILGSQLFNWFDGQ
jgi:hypothetical protein